jgi:tRNA A37 threonylcarbamoyladenosine biosynthesis protein TsaE
VDLYRLEGERDLYSTGMDEFFGEDGVTMVEWSERLLFPAEAAVVVEFEDAGGDSRIIRVVPSARRSPRASVASRKKDMVRSSRRKTAFRQRRTKE